MQGTTATGEAKCSSLSVSAHALERLRYARPGARSRIGDFLHIISISKPPESFGQGRGSLHQKAMGRQDDHAGIRKVGKANQETICFSTEGGPLRTRRIAQPERGFVAVVAVGYEHVALSECLPDSRDDPFVLATPEGVANALFFEVGDGSHFRRRRKCFFGGP